MSRTRKTRPLFVKSNDKGVEVIHNHVDLSKAVRRKRLVNSEDGTTLKLTTAYQMADHCTGDTPNARLRDKSKPCYPRISQQVVCRCSHCSGKNTARTRNFRATKRDAAIKDVKRWNSGGATSDDYELDVTIRPQPRNAVWTWV